MQHQTNQSVTCISRGRHVFQQLFLMCSRSSRHDLQREAGCESRRRPDTTWHMQLLSGPANAGCPPLHPSRPPAVTASPPKRWGASPHPEIRHLIPHPTPITDSR